MPRIDNLPDSSSAQRSNLNHQAIEDYLKTIYRLAEAESPVSTSRIAAERDVKPASVTSMIQRLHRLNLVDYEKHYGVTLTPAGRAIALEVIRHHRLIELYLIEALGFTWDEVHEQADILEHVISEKLEERIAAALNHPTLDPHGDPIPTRDGSLAQRPLVPLVSLEPGDCATLARIVDDSNSELLRYLAGQGLVPETVLTLKEIAPLDGPLTLDVAGRELVLGRMAAQAILVERR
ncbi:MAG: metal-dependent transcriptional regulator [Anaerolineae bacterium]|nr:metal-dependent transcriptional regulator [Anaerolineae bacterium]